MAIDASYQPDADVILSHRYDQGADFWTTPDKRLFKGAPFSPLDCAHMLLELGMEPGDPVLRGVAELFLGAWKADGRFKVYPGGAIYPCHTILTAELLCKLGYAGDERLGTTFTHLLATQREDGGWRCEKYSFGRGPETDYSNPLPTLIALSALRFCDHPGKDAAISRAVEFLLAHWTIRMPIGPCHYGIGSLFLQAEYPFRGYNLFQYVYILSFFESARGDPRFLEALAALQAKLVDGRVVVERVVPKLGKLSFCRKGQPSELAARRYREIMGNMKPPLRAAP